MTGIRRLNHAVLFVSDLERALAFYLSVLGFTVVSHERRMNAAFLRAADSGFVESLLTTVSNPEPIREQLRYPPLSVGESMEAGIPAVPVHWSIGQAREVVEEAARLQCPYLYVIDASGALVGVLQIRELDRFADSPVEAAMNTSIVRLHAYSPLESILDHPGWNEYDVLPVTGRMNTLVGVLRHKNLRRHGVAPEASSVGDESFADIALSLGELYWSGLWRVVAGFAPSQAGFESRPGDNP